MNNLNDIMNGSAFHQALDNPSVSMTSVKGHTLYLQLNSRDQILMASYQGPQSSWYSSLCELLIGLNLVSAQALTANDWIKKFGASDTFCELWTEREEDILFLPLELLKAALDKYAGREHLYQNESALICRCFGVRESDIIHYLKGTKEPSVADLSLKTKAGMGCRSCKNQLENWLVSLGGKKRASSRFYKDSPTADWLILIDEKLQEFPRTSEWRLEVSSMKGAVVIITYQKEVSQMEEEQALKDLQLFLGSAVDAGLSFFLRRARHLA